MIEPIFFKPSYKQVVWGGNKIKSFFNRDINQENIGESWELSAHTNGLSTILNESFNNENLYELFNDISRREEIFGSKCITMERFPILAKFIDAEQNLSIQVHPDDQYAMKYENDSGKSEVWYIMDCTEDAKIIYGFKDEAKQKDLKSVVENIEDNIKYINVKKGDFIPIPAGTVHAICGGLMLCEIQQSSDLTYRVHDWNRIGLDGKPRQLHTQKALDVIDINKNTSIYNYYNLDNTKTIYNSNAFNIDLLNVKGNLTMVSNKESFDAYVVISGNGKVIAKNFEKQIEKGSVFLIPAQLGTYELKGNIKLMKVYL